MTKHSRYLTPSAAAWKLKCTAASQAIIDAQEKGLIGGDEPSKYAAEGTVAHKLFEELNRTNDVQGIKRHIGKIKQASGFKFKIDREMVRYVVQSWDYHKTHWESMWPERSQCGIETRHPLFYEPKRKGTVDYWTLRFYNRMYELSIYDLKYGKGVKVYATENDQEKIYVINLMDDLGLNYSEIRINLHIIQPRLNHYDRWEFPVEDIQPYKEYVSRKYKLITSGKGEFKPSKSTCRFCPLRKHDLCDAYREWKQKPQTLFEFE
jgi:hypothetical protein